MGLACRNAQPASIPVVVITVNSTLSLTLSLSRTCGRYIDGKGPTN